MGERLEIALLYNYTPEWMGGVYYIQHIVAALNHVDDKEKPYIHVYSNSEKHYNELKHLTNYPYIEYHFYRFRSNVVGHFFNKILRRIAPYNYIPFGRIDLSVSPVKFAYPGSYVFVKPTNKIIAWIPDFQERYLPSLFTARAKRWRKKGHLLLIKKNIPIVFSSQDAELDFHRFYPEAKNRTFVLRFASLHPDFTMEDVTALRIKYGINKKYLFCANQFWVHKNHLFLFKAFRLLLEKGAKIQLVCSGALDDFRDREYSNKIRTFIDENQLNDDIKILGFIPRTEQLCLMKHAYAIVQPSLFEGWSTVVEDAKALNKFIFLSNLKVHVEQAPVNVCYFNPHDVNDLAEKLYRVKPTSFSVDYKENIQRFGCDYLRIIRELDR